MASKGKKLNISFKRKPKKEEKPIEPIVEETKPVDPIDEPTTEPVETEMPIPTVMENELINEQEPEVDNAPVEVEREARNIIGDVGGSKIIKPVGRIKFEAQVAPVPMFMLPADIRKYLQSHGLSSDVFKKDKERLEKHNVDMEIVNKLKKFLTERL